MENDRNITWHHQKVTKQDRWVKNSHRSALVWLTGLSASGKSTLANELERELYERQVNTFVLDGDNVRHGLNKDLGFGPAHRKENIRRVGEVAKLLVDAGVLTIAAFISPYVEDRQSVRQLFPEAEFIETFVRCDLSICEERDPKGLYKKARRGELPEFTGLSAPYEEPVSPELVVDTGKLSIHDSVAQIIGYLGERGII
jgi:adenylylsulfate kinase